MQTANVPPITSVFDRLTAISALQPGWMNGEGISINPIIIHLVEVILTKVNVPTPYIYPTISGGLLLNWQIDHWDISLEINPPKLDIVFHALNIRSGDEIEHVVIDLANMRDLLVDVFIKLNSQHN